MINCRAQVAHTQQQKIEHMMRKRIIYFLVLLLVSSSALGQKKEIAAARDFVKKGNNLDKAEQSMQGLLRDSANRQNEKIWDVLFESQRKQYDQGNEKLYLNQKYDTLSLFNIASRMMAAMVAYDSIDAMPDSKGRVKLSHRKDNAELLNTLRPNLYSGGLFLIRRQKYAEAYKLLNQYIDAARQPLFAAYRYAEQDRLLPVASYWAMYCSYKMQDTARVLLHAPLAAQDKSHHELVLQHLAETYQTMGRSTDYLATLNEGFETYPLAPFFYSHLMEYYTQNRLWDDALALTNRALKVDSTQTMFHLAKSSILLNLGEYEQCYAICDSLLEINDSLPEANLNAGLAKFNQGVMLDKTIQQSAKQKNRIMACYKEAMPYLETYRQMQPKNIEAWGLPLYTIYLNLNLGKKFDEIDQLMRKHR